MGSGTTNNDSSILKRRKAKFNKIFLFTLLILLIVIFVYFMFKIAVAINSSISFSFRSGITGKTFLFAALIFDIIIFCSYILYVKKYAQQSVKQEIKLLLSSAKEYVPFLLEVVMGYLIVTLLFANLEIADKTYYIISILVIGFTLFVALKKLIYKLKLN